MQPRHPTSGDSQIATLLRARSAARFALDGHRLLGLRGALLRRRDAGLESVHEVDHGRDDHGLRPGGLSAPLLGPEQGARAPPILTSKLGWVEVAGESLDHLTSEV